MITFTLGGLALNVDAVSFKEIPTPNATDIRTLQGNLYTDFTSFTRTWEIEWNHLDENDYNDLRDVWESQFTNNQYVLFVVPNYSISTLVKMDLNDKDITFQGCIIKGVSIRLQEQVAIS